MTIQEQATDNVRQTQTNRQTDLVTTIAPGISATADSPRLQGILDYSPQIVRNLNATDQNRTDHTGFATGVATIVPDHIFLSTIGSISEQSAAGGQNLTTTGSIPTNQRTQAIAYTVSPRVQYGLTDLLGMEADYSFAQNIFQNQSGSSTSSLGTSNVTNSTDQAGHVQIDTTSNAGPFYSKLSGDVLDESVSSSIISSRRIYATSHNEYAVVRPVALIGEIGYERLTFPRASQLDLSEPAWAVGARWRPNLNDWLLVTYGQRDGIYGFTGSLRYQVTPITFFTASYFETLSSLQQIIQQNLTTIGQNVQRDPTSTGQDVFGNVFDPTTQLPIFINNPNLSLRNDIFRDAQGLATVAVSQDRDTFAGTLFYERRHSQLGLTQNDETIGGTRSWTHAVTDRLKSYAIGGYAIRHVDIQTLATGTMGLSY
ncbi:MAG: TIGR03016 family PEP-CTERM system-associated outer membrane protein, partial [Acidimicrobiales bacterium]